MMGSYQDCMSSLRRYGARMETLGEFSHAKFEIIGLYCIIS